MRLEKYDFMVQFDMNIRGVQKFKLSLARSYSLDECVKIIDKILKEQK